MNKQVTIDPAELAAFCAAELSGKLAQDVQTLAIGEHSSVADYFVIATATSEPHLQALSGYLERQVREKYGARVHSGSGDSASGWVLLDFITVIVHVMTADMRARYSLETLWGGARPSGTETR
ncbi:MAG: ribosome silencing factor [Lentisphaeria bacterium]|nr:ribosome silencing factor [Lentisphaeria bacterium]